MSTSPQWGRTTKLLVASTLLVAAGLLFYSFRSILPLLTIAFLIAYVFAPVVGWLSERLRVKRGLAAVLLYVVLLALLGRATKNVEACQERNGVSRAFELQQSLQHDG